MLNHEPPKHMDNQRYLDLTPIDFANHTGLTIEQAFAQFHQANPHVYQNLVSMTRELVQKGRTRLGIAMLFEALRWSYMLVNDPTSEFKLNNNYKSRYARLIAEQEPDLQDVFQLRELKAP